jgi:hypothetical protein
MKAVVRNTATPRRGHRGPNSDNPISTVTYYHRRPRGCGRTPLGVRAYAIAEVKAHLTAGVHQRFSVGR